MTTAVHIGIPTYARIATDLGVTADFDVAVETDRRINFLREYLRESGATGYVLGISGGVDSTTAGWLAQWACVKEGKTFTAMRLPYGEQADEADAQAALAFIEPHETLTVNIAEATNAMMTAVIVGEPALTDAAQIDFVKGNIKARQRMVAQYAVAGAKGALVVGTDHAAEAVMGFFTKFGDGACDITPLAGLTKRQVRAIAEYLGAPEAIITKAPTADLEDLRPGLKDEDAYGIPYDVIDDYLEGDEVTAYARVIIETAYAKTAHKRAQPVGP